MNVLYPEHFQNLRAFDLLCSHTTFFLKKTLLSVIISSITLFIYNNKLHPLPCCFIITIITFVMLATFFMFSSILSEKSFYSFLRSSCKQSYKIFFTKLRTKHTLTFCNLKGCRLSLIFLKYLAFMLELAIVI